MFVNNGKESRKMHPKSKISVSSYQMKNSNSGDPSENAIVPRCFDDDYRETTRGPEALRVLVARC